ncbi:MAG: T9SS type A sorting domain-containing protein, partial [Bacteroidales bacterium]|nr:T9SS type A sorting domain-containing protein [Bacteroidales bacterium]
GGIAQYYDNEGTLVQDNNVPFVKTIARVTRDANGIMTEHKLPIEMPVLLGAGAEFIPNKNIAHYNNEVIKLDELTSDTTLVGYIYGGINSSAPNIFFTNTGSQSSANSQIFKVFLTKNTLSIDDFNEHSANSLQLLIYPNPSSEKLTIKYHLIKSSPIKITIRDLKGNTVLEEMMKNQSPGEHIITKDLISFVNSGVYFLTIESDYGIMTRKIITENR